MSTSDVAAEQGVIGGLLVYGGEHFAEVSAIVTDRDFYDQRNRHTFLAMAALAASNMPMDEITVTSWLNTHGTINHAGGPAYLAEVADMVVAPSGIIHYAKLVKEQAALRRIHAMCEDTIRKIAKGGSDPLEVAEQVRSDLLDVLTDSEAATVVDGPGLIYDRMRAAEARSRGEADAQAHPTGFDDLDRVTCGGPRDGDMVILAGRPSMGKTAFALGIATHWAIKENMRVLFFTLEQPEEQMVDRQICSEGRVNSSGWRNGNLRREDWARASDAGDRLAENPIAWVSSGVTTVSQIIAEAKRRAARDGVDAILVDYLQMLGGPEDSREQQISAISRGLKQLAKDLKVPVVALSQLNRKCESRNPPMPRMSDLRESGSLEQDADVIAFLFRPGHYSKDPKDKRVVVALDKQRNGPTGDIDMVYLAHFMRFEAIAYGEDES